MFYKFHELKSLEEKKSVRKNKSIGFQYFIFVLMNQIYYLVFIYMSFGALSFPRSLHVLIVLFTKNLELRTASGDISVGRGNFKACGPQTAPTLAPTLVQTGSLCTRCPIIT